jgi:hypothetical protein
LPFTIIDGHIQSNASTLTIEFYIPKQFNL